jgi:hypothetical protein
LRRRTLLTLGFGAATVLAIGGGSVALWRPGLVAGHLSEAGSGVMRAVALAVLDGVLPTEPMRQEAALQAHMARLDAAIAAFPPATRSELSQLLALLATPAGRWALAQLSTPWEHATVGQVQAALKSMRHASLGLRQQAYHALRKVTAAAYFADRSTWPALGYPGPLPI